jgi:hypothetical protein
MHFPLWIWIDYSHPYHVKVDSAAHFIPLDPEEHDKRAKHVATGFFISTALCDRHCPQTFGNEHHWGQHGH